MLVVAQHHVFFRNSFALGVAVFVATGCGSGTTTTTSATTTTVAGLPTTTAPGGPSSVTATSVAAPPDFSTTPVSVVDEGATALLTAVRAAAQIGFDRVTFGFANRLPGYEVGYVERPVVSDGSGEEVTVAGTAVLRVAMTPASGADLSGGGVETYTGPKRLTPGTPALAEIVQVGDFEGHLTWAIGVPTEAGFHVSTLDSPPRLVVDVSAG